VGAAARWGILDLVSAGHGFPWPVFVINVAGSALLGVVVARRWRSTVHDGIGIGFCGGFTTFSTFAVEVATFFRDGRAAIGITYAVTSVVAAVAVFALAKRAAT